MRSDGAGSGRTVACGVAGGLVRGLDPAAGGWPKAARRAAGAWRSPRAAAALALNTFLAWQALPQALPLPAIAAFASCISTPAARPACAARRRISSVIALGSGLSGSRRAVFDYLAGRPAHIWPRPTPALALPPALHGWAPVAAASSGPIRAPILVDAASSPSWRRPRPDLPDHRLSAGLPLPGAAGRPTLEPVHGAPRGARRELTARLRGASVELVGR